MKKYLSLLFLLIFVTLPLASCSITPERQVSLAELQRTKDIAYYIIEDDMEGVLKILNSDGEVVVRSELFSEPVYLQIFSTSGGIEIRSFSRDQYSAPDQ